MLSTPRKRHASRSPEGIRHNKRQLTSSPEEGEVDDSSPPKPPLPVILPISLPAKPPPPTKGVPFPFKKKEPSKTGATGERDDGQEAPLNVFDRFAANAQKAREDTNQTRATRNNAKDPWDVGPGGSSSLPPRPEPIDSNGRYDYHGRDRDRGYRRSPIRGYSPHYPRSSRSSPHYNGKHRLPAPRSPPTTFSPPTHHGLRERSRERDYDRDRDYRDDWDDNSRRYARRSPFEDDRYYRPPVNNQRRDDREWTRRGSPPYRGPSRGDKGYHNDSDYRYSDSRPPSRPISPRGPSTRSALVSPPPHSPPPIERSRPPSPACPPPPPPLAASSGPRPPSSTPPPAPPPDTRLLNVQLPPIHAQVKITMKRPDAPKNRHSPPPLDLPPVSTANAMANGVEKKHEQPQPPRQPPKDSKRLEKISEHPRIQEMRQRPLVKRTAKAEVQAYGHQFIGCGQQSDYETTTKLGEGTFGEVHKAIHKSTGAVVALKRILMHNEKEGMPVTALREIKILKALKHPCIVDILDMFVVRSAEDTPLSVFMVFPYMDHDLAGLLENERVKLQPSHIKLYMRQLLEGTDYMHRNHILHRDMKAANLLISNNGSLRIADFGLARTYDASVVNGRNDGQRGRERKYTNCVVTRWYRPPELLLGARHYGGEVDIWGIGCVLGEMFTRKPILPGTSDLDQLEKIWVLCGSPNQHNWPYFDQLPGCEGVIRFNSQARRLRQTYESVGPETVDLLDKLLVINPKERLTASEALDHDYFWTDPLPADPKSMPSYEASHEFDKRGHRHHQPMPIGPPQGHHPNLSRPSGPPPGAPHYNNRGAPNNHIRPPYGGGHQRNGPGGPPGPYPPSNGPPLNGPNSHPSNFRGMNPTLPPHPNPYGGSHYGPPGTNQFPVHLPRPPYPGPPQNQPNHRGKAPLPGSDRGWEQPRNSNLSQPPIALPPGLPQRPVAPLGRGTRPVDRQRNNHNDAMGPGLDGRGEPLPSVGPGSALSPGEVLNYG